MSEKRAASSPRTGQRKKPRKSVLKSEVNGPVRRSERRKSRVSFAPKNEVKEFDDYTSNSSANNSAAKDISVDKENTMDLGFKSGEEGLRPIERIVDTLLTSAINLAITHGMSHELEALSAQRQVKNHSIPDQIKLQQQRLHQINSKFYQIGQSWTFNVDV
ncbi:Oidioi.mRNA.OKI2018_I69.PAR.g10782.t1.cds [Oikopleura dioica]|uniref:Oidioi.mRNA.OKI2018_I69.PAR.g10782.t1.cds n=1 Tax=Oikopleura dioica TaxID=34765 RepID=A0ABN7RT67_OIKDI|nr:Oidioi.mRNA.OKI2018_I69.PAR.g10782.t1.cds [Oikopleura dioica]